MDTIQFMVRLFSLLGECSSKDLLHASEAAGKSTTLGRALRLLAEYRRQFGASGLSPVHIDAVTTHYRIKEKPSSPLSGTAIPRSLEARLREVILSSKYFATTAKVLDHLQHSGVSVRYAKKEGRRRVFERLMKILNEMPTSERAIIFERLLSVLPPSETARWFSAIRRGS